jgi:hypothetical protein
VKTHLDGDNLIEVNNLAADPLIKPNQMVDGATWSRTDGLDRTSEGTLCHRALGFHMGWR